MKKLFCIESIKSLGRNRQKLLSIICKKNFPPSCFYKVASWKNRALFFIPSHNQPLMLWFELLKMIFLSAIKTFLDCSHKNLKYFGLRSFVNLTPDPHHRFLYVLSVSLNCFRLDSRSEITLVTRTSTRNANRNEITSLVSTKVNSFSTTQTRKTPRARLKDNRKKKKTKNWMRKRKM